jgi:integrase
MANIEKRVSADGKVSYRVKVRLKGYDVQTATFERLTDAKKWEQDTESAIRAGRYFKKSESKKRTVGDMLERYDTYLKKHNPKRHQDVKGMLLWWKENLGRITLADVTKSMLIEKRDLLINTPKQNGEPRSPAAVNRYMTALSTVFSVAVNDWEWLDTHPMQKLAKLREPRGRVRFLDDKERAKLLKACQASKNPYLYLTVVLALSTGARKGEIQNIKWQDVDFARKAIVLHDTKNNERRVLPLAGHALELMRKHQKVQRIDSPFVFPSYDKPSQPQDVRAAWETALAETGIQDFRFHDLRHSAASYLAMNGASLAEIAEVLGHKTLAMVKRYAHLSEAHTSKVVASMNERIFG